MANAAEASASTARPRKKRQRRVKHQQQEGTEPTRGLSKDEKESPADSRKRTNDRNLRTPCQPQCRPSRIKGRNTRGKVLGKERQGEDGRVEKPATCTCCGGLDWPSDS